MLLRREFILRNLRCLKSEPAMEEKRCRSLNEEIHGTSRFAGMADATAEVARPPGRRKPKGRGAGARAVTGRRSFAVEQKSPTLAGLSNPLF